jgi:hypothetical protein
MFIGHYGPALAAKGFAKAVPLWVLFVAAQWVDFLWAGFVIVGIEKVRIIENFFGLSPLDLYYMPYSHGLPSRSCCRSSSAASSRRCCRAIASLSSLRWR